MMVRLWVLRLSVVAAVAGLAACATTDPSRGPGMNVFWGGAPPMQNAAADPMVAKPVPTAAPAAFPLTGVPFPPGAWPDPAPLPPPPGPPETLGSFLDGPVGQGLGAFDRASAYHAIGQALDSNQRFSWRGTKGGVFGYVVPGTIDPGATQPVGGATPPGECRDFTQTVFIAGRPQSGKGTACRDANGLWRVTT